MRRERARLGIFRTKFFFSFLIYFELTVFGTRLGWDKTARFVDDLYLFFAGLRLRSPGSEKGGREGGVGIVHLIWPCGGKGWCWA
jgi:hypothetical protein